MAEVDFVLSASVFRSHSPCCRWLDPISWCKMCRFYFGCIILVLFSALEKLLSRLSVLPELDLVIFQSRSGISVEDCLVLVDLYLQLTVVEIDGALYAVAPILSEVFLNLGMLWLRLTLILTEVTVLCW